MPFDVSPLMLLAAVAGGSGDSSRTASPRAGPSTRTARSARSTGGRSSSSSRARSRSARSWRGSRCPSSSAVFGAYTVALILLLATDLDQRLLPDLITLPAIPIAFVFAVSGLDPFVPAGDLPLTIVVALAIPAILGVLAIPFGAGAIGMGDLKLLVSAGLLLGPGADRVGRRLGRAVRRGGDPAAAGHAAGVAAELRPVRALPHRRRAVRAARDQVLKRDRAPELDPSTTTLPSSANGRSRGAAERLGRPRTPACDPWYIRGMQRIPDVDNFWALLHSCPSSWTSRARARTRHRRATPSAPAPSQPRCPGGTARSR